MDFHERVRHEYLRLADAEPDRIVVIDAVGTVDEVFSEIRGVLVERFEGGSVTIDEADDTPVSAPAQGASSSSSPEVPEAAVAAEKSPNKGSSRKPATMVGALGESQGALWDE